MRATSFGGAYKKAYSRLGFKVGSPHFGKLPYKCVGGDSRIGLGF